MKLVPSNEPEISKSESENISPGPSLNQMSELEKSPGLPLLKFNIIHPIS
jgi:hypothetical protein